METIPTGESGVDDPPLPTLPTLGILATAFSVGPILDLRLGAGKDTNELTTHALPYRSIFGFIASGLLSLQ